MTESGSYNVKHNIVGVCCLIYTVSFIVVINVYKRCYVYY